MQRANIALVLAATLAAGCTEVRELLGDIGGGSGHGHGGGAEPFPPPPSGCGPTLGVDELYATVASDLAGMDADDQPFQRYVTLANRFNAGVCDEALAGPRAAISELFNSLSNSATLSQPLAIDADELTYRVDLRDYDWDRELELDGQSFADGWEAALARSPFAVEYEGPDANDAKADARTRVPLLNFDALADVVSESSLYYALVNVPQSSDALFEALGIDLEANRRDGAAALAGTTRSRISRADRIVERNDLEVRAGFIWRALDFLDESNVDIFEDPLSARSDGSVALFTLPNGLLGFAIFDAEGARVDDSDILLDTNQLNFRAKVVSSCLNCHAGAGVFPVVDEVRAFTLDNAGELDPELVAGVQRLYPPEPELAALFADDAAAYGAALERAGVVAGGADPLASALLEFEGDVRFEAMAGDLWVSQQALIDNRDALPTVFLLPFSARDEYAVFYAEAACAVAGSDNRPVGCD